MSQHDEHASRWQDGASAIGDGGTVVGGDLLRAMMTVATGRPSGSIMLAQFATAGGTATATAGRIVTRDGAAPCSSTINRTPSSSRIAKTGVETGVAIVKKMKSGAPP